MRVISGLYKGRKLIAPKGERTRPTLDRCKETLFNVLNFRLEGATFLDLFCGSGQNGIEALSRGAKECVFVDNDTSAIAAVKTNLTAIGVSAEVLCCDYETALARLNGRKFDFVYMDPPFKRENYYAAALELICRLDLLTEDGEVVCECPREYVPACNTLEISRERAVGTVKFIFYKRKKI